jgi:hypothetical protein
MTLPDFLHLLDDQTKVDLRDVLPLRAPRPNYSAASTTSRDYAA